ncbi:MAG TPA: tetratricopeptide repeat protein [Gemmataceae bacterium]|nr:tetratricopeptide repeat protein [Gemmataceae bacterium]
MLKLSIKVLLPLLIIISPVAGFIGYRLYLGRTASLLARGQEAVQRGDFREASRLVEQLESKGQTDPARLLRCEALVSAGEAAARGEAKAPAKGPSPAQTLFRGALEQLEQIPVDGPYGSRGSILAAQCLMHLHQQRLAEERLQKIIERDPDNREAHRLLAGVYLDLNSRSRAVAEFREWARLDPDNGLPYRWIGFFQKDYDAADEAIDAYNQALARHLTPDMHRAVLKELAQTYLLMGKYQLALNTLAQRPADFAGDLDVLLTRAECFFSLRREGEAAKVLDAALSKHPDEPRLLRLRAQVFTSEDKPEKARPLLEKAAQLDAYDLRTQLLLLDTYRQLKNEKLVARQTQHMEAVRNLRTRLTALTTGADQQPWNDRLRVEIAELCVQIHATDAARTWLRAALACNPANTQAQELLAKLPADRSASAR